MANNKKKEILLRAYLGFLFICLLGIAILGRTFYIQTVQGPYYRSLADSLTIFPKKIMAERGNIAAAGMDGKNPRAHQKVPRAILRWMVIVATILMEAMKWRPRCAGEAARLHPPLSHTVENLDWGCF